MKATRNNRKAHHEQTYHYVSSPPSRGNSISHWEWSLPARSNRFRCAVVTLSPLQCKFKCTHIYPYAHQHRHLLFRLLHHFFCLIQGDCNVFFEFLRKREPVCNCKKKLRLSMDNDCLYFVGREVGGGRGGEQSLRKEQLRKATWKVPDGSDGACNESRYA